MHIRNYQSGDEQAQADIYNTAAGALPKFKPANAGEIARRYQQSDPDPASKFYAVDNGQIVGYAVYNPNGRISYPWCLPSYESAQPLLLDAVLNGLRQRGCRAAWATYRADWQPVLGFLAKHGFGGRRDLINYVADLARLPQSPTPAGYEFAPLRKSDMQALWDLGRDLFGETERGQLEDFYFANTYFDPSAIFVLWQQGTLWPVGVGVTIVNPQYADPLQIDPAMPCFRLGALGTETERHKRVNGMFSCVFRDDTAGKIVLAEAARRLTAAGLTHAAAQAPSDQRELIAFYDRFFLRHGSFPILARSLTQ